MKKLFEKNEITFAVVLIVIYVAGASVMQRISKYIGTEFIAEMLFDFIFTVILLMFIRKNKLTEYLGLCQPQISAVKMWFYLPLVISAILPALFGIKAQFPAGVLVCRTVSMLFVGFLEEIMFRGFLFKGICKENISRAILISSLTFGIGHIVNLLNGYRGFDAVLQVIFAVCAGFLLVFVFCKTGSLLPCIAFHALNNCLTGFTSAENFIAVIGSEKTADIILTAIRIVIMLVYLIYMIKKLPNHENHNI